MKPYLRFPFQIYCPHGGQVTIEQPGTRAWFEADNPVAIRSDIHGKTITGCSLATCPCTSVQVIEGFADDFQVEGEPALYVDCRVQTNMGCPCSIVSDPHELGEGAGVCRATPAKPQKQDPNSCKPGPRTTVRVQSDFLATRLTPEQIASEFGVVRGVNLTFAQGAQSFFRWVAVPTDGTPVELTIPMEPDTPGWGLAQNLSGWLSLDLFQVGTEPPRVGGEGQRRRVRDRSSFRSRLAGPKPTLVELRGLQPLPEFEGARPDRYPDGWIVPVPLQLSPGSSRELVLRPQFPRLLQLRAAHRRLEIQIKQIEKERDARQWFSRAAMAQVCRQFGQILPTAEKSLGKVADCLQAGEPLQPHTRAPICPTRYSYESFERDLAAFAARVIPDLEKALNDLKAACGDSPERFQSLQKELELFLDLAVAPPPARSTEPVEAARTAALYANEAGTLVRQALETLASGLQLYAEFERLEKTQVESRKFPWEDWEQWYFELHRDLLGREQRLLGREKPLPSPRPPEPNVPSPVSFEQKGIGLTKSVIEAVPLPKVDADTVVARVSGRKLVFDVSDSLFPIPPGLSSTEFRQRLSRMQFVVEVEGITVAGSSQIVHQRIAHVSGASKTRYSSQRSTLVLEKLEIDDSVVLVDSRAARLASRLGVLRVAMLTGLTIAWYAKATSPRGRKTVETAAIDGINLAKHLHGLVGASLDAAVAIGKLKLPRAALGGRNAMLKAGSKITAMRNLSKVLGPLGPMLDISLATAEFADGQTQSAIFSSASAALGVLLLFNGISLGVFLGYTIALALLDCVITLHALEQVTDLELDLEALVALIDRCEFGAHPDRSLTPPKFQAELVGILQRLPWRLHSGLVRWPTPMASPGSSGSSAERSPDGGLVVWPDGSPVAAPPVSPDDSLAGSPAASPEGSLMRSPALSPVVSLVRTLADSAASATASVPAAYDTLLAAVVRFNPVWAFVPRIIGSIVGGHGAPEPLTVELLGRSAASTLLDLMVGRAPEPPDDQTVRTRTFQQASQESESATLLGWGDFSPAFFGKSSIRTRADRSALVRTDMKGNVIVLLPPDSAPERISGIPLAAGAELAVVLVQPGSSGHLPRDRRIPFPVFPRDLPSLEFLDPQRLRDLMESRQREAEYQRAKRMTYRLDFGKKAGHRDCERRVAAVTLDVPVSGMALFHEFMVD